MSPAAGLPRVSFPRLPLGVQPTPVHGLPELSPRLWVKRDDVTSELYGGNKPRKLEYLLGDARAKGRKRLVTVGGVGSNHLLATALFGARHGFEVEAVLLGQPPSEKAVANLRAALGQGLRARPVGARALTGVLLRQLLGRSGYFIALGGSNLVGTVGLVEAARELAEQVRGGLLPEPDVMVVALGSGGSAAGLAVGAELFGLKSRVVAVNVSGSDLVYEHLMTRRLVRETARAFGVDEGRALRRVRVDSSYLGEGHGNPSSEGARATQRAAGCGLTLESSYTAKAFAAALDLVASEESGHVLYWHTASGAPAGPLLEGAPTWEQVDPRIRALLA